jgi:hypothetical protein
MATILQRNVKNSFNSKNSAVTIYRPNGEAVVTTRLNARDLIAGGFTWAKPTPTDTDNLKEAKVKAAKVEAPVPEVQLPLEELATLAGGSVTDLLKGYTLRALHVLALQRYGKKINKNAMKPAAIDKIISLEANWIDNVYVPPVVEEPYDERAEQEQLGEEMAKEIELSSVESNDVNEYEEYNTKE